MIAAASIVIALPFLTTVFLLHHHYQTSFFQTVPVNADEILYWHQGQTFAKAGFSGGYYTTGEHIPRVGQYFTWGIFTPIFYGTFGALLGWPLWAMSGLNYVFLALATAAFIWLARLKFEQLCWLAAILTLYHPIIIFGPTQQVEILVLAFAVLLAGLFARLIRLYQQGQPLGRLAALTFVAILMAALIRMTWAALLLPLAVLVLRPNAWHEWLRAILYAILLAILPTLVYVLTSAPYLGNTLYLLSENPSLQNMLHLIGDNFIQNLQFWGDGDHLEIQMRWLTVAFIAVLSVVTVFQLYKWQRRTAGQQPVNQDMMLAWFFLTVSLLFILLIYNMYVLRGYRMLAGPLLLAAVLALAFKRRLLVIPLVIYLVAALPYANEYYYFSHMFTVNAERRAQVDEFSPQYAAVMPFDADAPNPWCNSVLLDFFYGGGQTSVAVSIPAGIGISYPSVDDYPMTIKSYYVGLRDVEYTRLRDRLNLVPLIQIPDGWLYRNLDSPCETGL